MLNDKQILYAMNGSNSRRHSISIDPFNRENLGPNSYDLTLSGKAAFLGDTIYDSFLDVTKKVPPSYESDSEQGMIFLKRGKVVFLMSQEIVTVRKPYVGIVSPRSGFSHLPLMISYSHLVDTGYSGVIGISVQNLAPYTLALHKGQRFMQIMFHSCRGDFDRTYTERKSSKYVANDGSFVPVYKIDKEWLNGAT